MAAQRIAFSPLRSFLWVFVALSAFGLIVSLYVHLGALMGHRVAPAAFFFILHVGIFVVWIPAVLVSRRYVGSTRGRKFWTRALSGCPEWMRYMVYGFLGYALLNFAVFMLRMPNSKSGGTNPPAEVWRGFSGHWMAFYSAALGILYSAASGPSTLLRCLNGHAVRPGAAYCEQCGQAVTGVR